MIYFVQPVEGGPVKIGTSVDVDARIRGLESHYGRPLALLAVMEGGRDEERAIHERFSRLRFGRTEQFRPEPELMEFIGKPLFVNASPVVEPMAAGVKPVRLVLTERDHARLEAAARRVGLSLASYARQALIERIAADEARDRGIR